MYCLMVMMEHLAYNKIPKGPEKWKVHVRQACWIKLYSLIQLFWRHPALTSIVIFTSCSTREKPKLENQPIKAASWSALLVERHDIYCNGSWEEPAVPAVGQGILPPVYAWCGDVEFESHYKSWLKSSFAEPEPEPQDSDFLPERNWKRNAFRFWIRIRIQHKKEYRKSKMRRHHDNSLGNNPASNTKKEKCCTISFSLKNCT